MISDTSGKRFWVIVRVAESQPLGTSRNPSIERFAFKNLGGLVPARDGNKKRNSAKTRNCPTLQQIKTVRTKITQGDFVL
jgi:hypothetical protein